MSKSSNTMQSLSGYVPVADFYSTTPEFRLRGKSRYSSCLGFLLSIGIFIFILVMFIYLVVNLANKKNPIVVVSELPTGTEQDNIQVFTPGSTFQMGFGVLFLYGYIDNMVGGVYTAKAAVKYLNSTTNTYEYKALELEKCQPIHFQNWDPEFERILCFSQDTSAEIAELFVRTEEERSIIIHLYECTSQCVDNINTVLYYSGFVTVHTAWFVDPLNRTNPLNSELEQTYAGIPRGIQRELTMSLSTIQFSSDNGWLFKSTTTETVRNLESIDQDMYNMTIGDFEKAFGITQAPFMSLVIVNSGEEVLYTRKYKKIQDIFAEITGFTTILIPIVGILLLPSLKYSRLKVYEKTANELYQARKEDLERHYKHNRRNQRSRNHSRRSQKSPRTRSTPTHAHAQNTVPTQIELPNIPNLQAIPSTETVNQINLTLPSLTALPVSSVVQENEHNNNNQPMPILLDDKGREYAPVKISFLKWVKSFFRPEPDIQMLSQAIEEIEATMDIATLIEKLMEIEKLKRCIMSEDQRILFDNLDKPVLVVDGSQISLEENKRDERVGETGAGGETRSHKPTPEEIYENLKGKEVITELEQQLILFYEKKIK